MIYLVGNIGASIVYASFSSYTHGTGASPGIYALIACIVILHIQFKSFLNLDFSAYPVSYTLFYAVLGNFVGIRTLIVHVLGFGFGAFLVLGCMFLNVLL